MILLAILAQDLGLLARREAERRIVEACLTFFTIENSCKLLVAAILAMHNLVIFNFSRDFC